MSVREYHKLVRDNIPDIIAQSGEKAVTRELSAREYKTELCKKLLEETREYLTSEAPEELADIMEVIHALAELGGIAFQDLEQTRLRKREKNGGFWRRMYLERVIAD